MTKPDETPPGTTGPAAATPGTTVVDEDSLTKLIEARATDIYNKLRGKPDDAATPPAAAAAAPAAGGAAAATDGPGFLAAINEAVRTALDGRDREDQVALLSQEVTKLQASIPAPKKRSWADFLTGPLFK